MRKIQVNKTAFKDDHAFHKQFAEIMGFPGFYGHNWDAWIDCMSYIDEPDEQMSQVPVKKNEILEIEILIKDGNNYYNPN